jgi:hypothetical protein
MGSVTFSLRDYDNEATSCTFNTSDLTDGNIVTEYAEAVDLQAKLAAITLGNLVRRKHTAISSPQGVGRSTNPQAAREAKALVSYHDTITFERAEVAVPTIDLSKQMPTHPGFFYLRGVAGADADIEAFVTSMETTVVGPGGNPIQVDEIYHIGVST